MPIWIIAIVIQIAFGIGKPKPRTPNEFFNICVIKNEQPINLILKEYKGELLCDTPLNNVPMNNPIFHFHLDNIDNEWELTTFSDSMADPFVYRYKIENHQVIPLWYHFGGNSGKMSVVVFGFFMTLILLSAVKVVRKRLNKPQNKR